MRDDRLTLDVDRLSVETFDPDPMDPTVAAALVAAVLARGGSYDGTADCAYSEHPCATGA